MQNKQDLPREKLSKKGAEALSDLELLQVLIGSGTKGHDYKKIARELNYAIQAKGTGLSYDDVMEIKGIGAAKGAIVFAALEYWRRKFTKQTRPVIDSPEKAAEQFSFIKDKRQENFAIITLDGARRLISTHTITVGTLTSSLVHPREVFTPAMEDRAASIIAAHNHPSGSLDISSDDMEVTKRLRDAGELLGISLDDHMIVTGEGFVSIT